MTSQSKNTSSRGGQRRRSSGTNTEARAATGVGTVNVGGGAGSQSGVGGDIKPTKNTRRRVHPKRTRNTTRPNQNEDKTKPVLESTNPFFIAVCAPDTYKPSIAMSMGYSGGRNGSGGSGRRDSSSGSSSHRRMPNVFLRSNSRNSSSSVSNGPGGVAGASASAGVNPFIHHPVIQHDRQRGGNGGAGGTRGDNTSNNHENNYSTITSDIEQFPSLGSSGTSVVPTKLNFKEIILKNSSGSGESKPTTSSAPPPPPKVRTEYAQQSQKTLSSGNIFLGAFYGGSRDTQDGWNDDDDYEGDEGDGNGRSECGSGRIISSSLIDSCDRKYDKLYR
jgi:hypothetical protein